MEIDRTERVKLGDSVTIHGLSDGVTAHTLRIEEVSRTRCVNLVFDDGDYEICILDGQHLQFTRRIRRPSHDHDDRATLYRVGDAVRWLTRCPSGGEYKAVAFGPMTVDY